MHGMLYHTGYRLIDKDDLLLLSTAVYISSHGDRIFIEIVSASVFIEREDYVYTCVYICIYLYMKQERIEEADFDGLSRFIKFQELVHADVCVCFRDDRCNC